VNSTDEQDILILDYGTDTLSRNIGKKNYRTLRHKIEYLNYMAAKA
jgi:hypothetical protein